MTQHHLWKYLVTKRTCFCRGETVSRQPLLSWIRHIQKNILHNHVLPKTCLFVFKGQSGRNKWKSENKGQSWAPSWYAFPQIPRAEPFPLTLTGRGIPQALWHPGRSAGHTDPGSISPPILLFIHPRTLLKSIFLNFCLLIWKTRRSIQLRETVMRANSRIEHHWAKKHHGSGKRSRPIKSKLLLCLKKLRPRETDDSPMFHRDREVEPTHPGAKPAGPLNPLRCPRNISKIGLLFAEVKAPNARTSVPFLIQTEVPLFSSGIWVTKRESQVRIDSAFQTRKKKKCLSLAGCQMSKKLITEREGPKDIIDKWKNQGDEGTKDILSLICYFLLCTHAPRILVQTVPTSLGRKHLIIHQLSYIIYFPPPGEVFFPPQRDLQWFFPCRFFLIHTYF